MLTSIPTEWKRWAGVVVALTLSCLLVFAVWSGHVGGAGITQAAEMAPTKAVTFPFTLTLDHVVTAPNQITFLTHAGDGSGRLFLVEKQGRILIIEDGSILSEPFLDITGKVKPDEYEQGLLSVAFAPNYETSGVFYVNYTTKATGTLDAGTTVIERYQVSAGDANVADPTSAETVLTIDQPATNHNGGQLHFGPDGYLYVGTGDGGGSGDPNENAENLNTLLGKMLRLDVTGEATYTIPSDNPFVEVPSARGEIWAYGLRNPWRFSFDRQSGDLYIADVGQNGWEEVNFQPADSAGGEHYGWDTMEGAHCYEPPSGCDTSGKVLPVTEYDHDLGHSVTGGYVYRGATYPTIAGRYFFADFGTGRIWGLTRNGTTWERTEHLNTDLNISSFGEDEDGELYVLDIGGDVYRLGIGQWFLPLIVQDNTE